MSDEIRAYNAGYKQGIKDERERIIALLEKNTEALTAIEYGYLSNHAETAIALISENEPSIIQDNDLNYIMGDDK